MLFNFPPSMGASLWIQLVPEKEAKLWHVFEALTQNQRSVYEKLYGDRDTGIGKMSKRCLENQIYVLWA